MGAAERVSVDDVTRERAGAGAEHGDRRATGTATAATATRTAATTGAAAGVPGRELGTGVATVAGRRAVPTVGCRRRRYRRCSRSAPSS